MKLLKNFSKLELVSKKRIFSIRVSASKKREPEDTLFNACKRVRTPSPARNVSDKQLEEWLLYRSRLKYAILKIFLGSQILSRLPRKETQGVWAPSIIKSPSLVTVKAAINTLKSLIVHSIVQTQHNNWIFITQVEVYYHDKETDDVAQVDKHNEYSKTLTVYLTNRQEDFPDNFQATIVHFPILIVINVFSRLICGNFGNQC
ncbi:hypothetical protein EDC94DRAFT_583890 [Helicostylum pulchrum]|nr:hypothetical protein EDC94DRAFT_583890 [Helicostylum pulchrum]